MAAYSDDPLLQMANAHHYNKHEVNAHSGIFTAGNWAVPEERRTGPLRIGYLSSDLREHAVGFLTTEIFELHNRDKVEIFAYYCGVPSTDSTNAEIKKTVRDHWVDLRDMDDRTAHGYPQNRYPSSTSTVIPRGARLEIPMRAGADHRELAGFSGWAGHNFTISVADEYIIPKANQIYYTERVMRLPCYQPNWNSAADICANTAEYSTGGGAARGCHCFLLFQRRAGKKSRGVTLFESVDVKF